MKNLTSAIVLATVLVSTLSPAHAYFHSYGPHAQVVRLTDKIERLTKKVARTSNEFDKAKISIEIQEAQAEIQSLEAK